MQNCNSVRAYLCVYFLAVVLNAILYSGLERHLAYRYLT